RRPFRRAAVRGGMPGRVHRPRPRPSGKPGGAAGEAAAPAARASGTVCPGGCTMRLSARLLALAFLFLSAAPAALLAADGGDAPQAARPPGAAIASAHELATAAGFEVLEQGGNAFDAAVAVSAALSVVEPISSGLDGGGFFLLHDAASGRDVFVGARETAPAAATPERYRDANRKHDPDRSPNGPSCAAIPGPPAAPAAATPERYRDANGKLDRDRSQNGPWSAAIPGLPAGLVHVAEKYGRLPLKTSLAPAIRLAREGFPVYARLERGYAARRQVMERYPGTRAVFLAGGKPPVEGQLLRQPDLARTLEALAERGFDGFYRGPVAKKLLAGVRAEG